MEKVGNKKWENLRAVLKADYTRNGEFRQNIKDFNVETAISRMSYQGLLDADRIMKKLF
ncbi:MAG: hypothetical protein QME14_00715 [Methanobacteriaceae archaeon]|nr:hypothetical protein [Methanobacteriaceae archaeon]